MAIVLSCSRAPQWICEASQSHEAQPSGGERPLQEVVAALRPDLVTKAGSAAGPVQLQSQVCIELGVFHSMCNRKALLSSGSTSGIRTRRAGKLCKARYRLYRSQILRVNTCWKVLADIYTMHSFAPFLNSIIENWGKKDRSLI